MGRQVRLRVVLAVALLGVPSLGWTEPQEVCGAQIPGQIRVTDCAIARALKDGLARSESLVSLVERIGSLKGIVYVSLLERTRAQGVAGGLSHKVSAGTESCILQVGVVRDYAYGDRTIVTLAHEFRHVLEVLEHPEARTEQDVDLLYTRIGRPSAAGAMETEAALETERIVANELKHNKKRSGA
jgi:hypothetical protein